MVRMEPAVPGSAAMAFPMVRRATAVSTITLFMMVFPLFLQWRECGGKALNARFRAVAGRGLSGEAVNKPLKGPIAMRAFSPCQP
jgi:hypothetical protein